MPTMAILVVLCSMEIVHLNGRHWHGERMHANAIYCLDCYLTCLAHGDEEGEAKINVAFTIIIIEVQQP